MAIQVISRTPEGKSRRQLAQEALDKGLQAGAQVFEGIQRTRRQEAQDAERQANQKFQRDAMFASKGIDPTQFNQEQLPPQQGEMSDLPATTFGPQDGQASAFSQLAEQARKQQEQKRADIERGFGLREQAIGAKSAETAQKRAETQERRQQELETPFGIARTKDDAKKIKEGAISKASFDSKLDELIKLRKDFGSETYNRTAVNRGKQLSKQLLLQMKDMSKLGVLSAHDERILDQILPGDPLQIDLTGSTLSNLKNLKTDTQKDFEAKLGQRLSKPSQGIAQSRGGQPAPTTPQEAAPGLAKTNPAKAQRLFELRQKAQQSQVGQR